MKKLAIFPVVAAAFMVTGIADRADAAVVYCKTVGVPKGCVVRPASVVAPAVVVAPAAPVARAAVRTPAVGVGVNRGGPVNRRGVR